MIKIEKLVDHPLDPKKAKHDIKIVLQDLVAQGNFGFDDSFEKIIEAVDYIEFLENKLAELIKCLKNASNSLLVGEDNEKIFG